MENKRRKNVWAPRLVFERFRVFLAQNSDTVVFSTWDPHTFPSQFYSKNSRLEEKLVGSTFHGKKTQLFAHFHVKQTTLKEVVGILGKIDKNMSKIKQGVGVGMGGS